MPFNLHKSISCNVLDCISRTLTRTLVKSSSTVDRTDACILCVLLIVLLVSYHGNLHIHAVESISLCLDLGGGKGPARNKKIYFQNL